MKTHSNLIRFIHLIVPRLDSIYSPRTDLLYSIPFILIMLIIIIIIIAVWLKLFKSLLISID